MSWAALFERASEHETTMERVRTTLAAVRARDADDGGARRDDA